MFEFLRLDCLFLESCCAGRLFAVMQLVFSGLVEVSR